MRRAAATGLALCLLLGGCIQPPTTITATGRVRADELTVQAPTLDVPRLSLDAGFETAPGTRPALSPVPVLFGFASAQRVAAVRVRLGQSVQAGDVLLRFDDAALSAQVRIAKADAATADARVGVIDAAIETTRDREDDLLRNRRKVTDGIAKATDARADLAGKLADARSAARRLPQQLSKVASGLHRATTMLSQVERRLRQVTAALAALPAGAPPAVREPLVRAQRQLTAARSGLRAGIERLKAARKQLATAIARVQGAIPQLARAIRTIDHRVARAREALERIDNGRQRIREARADLRRARRLAVIAASDTTGTDRAATARNQAVVRAPADGVVAGVRHVGDVVAPGATVATVSRPSSVVSTWLAPAQVARLCLGDAVTLTDDFPGPAPSGTVTRILPEATYPPSHSTTADVHLTRAVGVEVTVDAALPFGVPVDLHITPCRTPR